MKRRNMTAMAMAAMMIMANVSPSVMAYANSITLDGIKQNNTGKTEGDVTAKNGADYTTGSVTGAVTAENSGTTVTVTGSAGSVDASDGATVKAGTVTGTVEAEDDGTTVTVTGSAGSVDAKTGSNVSAGSTSGKVEANNATVTVDGKIGGGVDASNGATVDAGSVTGKVEADGTDTTVTVEEDAGSVEAINSATVYVGSVTGVTTADNATVTVTDDAGNVVAENGAKVTVGGDLITADGNAIKITGNSVSVIVKGDVETTDEKISINASGATDGNSEIAIGGTLKNKDNVATLAVATTKKEVEGDDVVVVVDETKLPEIVVGTIEDVKKLTVTDSNGDALSDEEAKKVIENIKYIIDEDDLSKGILTITQIDGTTAVDKDKSQTYNVAKAGTTFMVKVNVADGYELSDFSAGTNAVWENKGDGSYIVQMPAGGGVSLKAVLTLIKKAEEAKKTEATTTTVTRTSSGGGSGSSSSGSHAIAVTPGAGRTSIPTTPGSWKKNADNTWSYVNADGGIYKSSWIVSNNRWYYADANGRIVTSWTEINGVWYYFSVTNSTENPEGAMLAGTTTPDGYKLDSNGAWVK